jgi:hypothetical protein
MNNNNNNSKNKTWSAKEWSDSCERFIPGSLWKVGSGLQYSIMPEPTNYLFGGLWDLNENDIVMVIKTPGPYDNNGGSHAFLEVLFQEKHIKLYLPVRNECFNPLRLL